MKLAQLINLTIITHSPDETRELGWVLGSLLKKGDVVALIGDLGAGKTCFVQGVAKGLGVPEESYVRSPSFVIMNEYRGRLPLYHFDFYRIDDIEGLINIDIEDYLYGDGVTLIEWADRGLQLLSVDPLLINFQFLDEKARRIEFEGSKVWMDVLKVLKEKYKTKEAL